MAKLAVFASGSGSNFEAIADHIANGPHEIACLVCDRPQAPVLQRARRLDVPEHVVRYGNRPREEAEQEILGLLRTYRPDLVALAGFMRLLSPFFLDTAGVPVINVHPSLLPRYPGVGAIEQSYRSGDNTLGITIHHVDDGLDTGPTILQKAFQRTGTETLQDIEQRIHQLEHQWYPHVVAQLLDGRNSRSGGGFE